MFNIVKKLIKFTRDGKLFVCGNLENGLFNKIQIKFKNEQKS